LWYSQRGKVKSWPTVTILVKQQESSIMKIRVLLKAVLLIGLVLAVGGLALIVGRYAEAMSAASLPDVQPDSLQAVPLHSNLPGLVGVSSNSTTGLASAASYTTTCTLAYTYAPDGIGGSSFATAPLLAPYTNLVLAYGTSGDTVIAYPEYFYLDVQAGVVYRIDAIPNSTTNYNLGMVLYNSSYTPILSDTNPLDNNLASLSFLKSPGRYYIMIYQLTPGCLGGSYKFITTAATPTPTPTITPTPTNTPTPSSGNVLTDSLEGPAGNNTFVNAAAVSVGGTYSNLTFYWHYPTPDVDYYKFWTKAGRKWQVETKISPGLDTVVYIYNSAQQLVASNDDKTFTDYGSLVEWTSGSVDDWYYAYVINKDPTDPCFTSGSGTYCDKEYQLIISEEEPPTATPTNTPGPTATPGPSPTPLSGFDRFEPNYDFDHATTIALGVKYDNLNFVPYPPADDSTPDNDFYKLRVKPGVLVTCETLDLSPGTDTNMILYNNDRQGIGGNDDVNTAAGDFSSRFSYFATYEGWLYILVGQGHPVPLIEANKYTYSLECLVGSLATATPTEAPTPTAVFYPTPVPLPTYTPYPTFTPLSTSPLFPSGPTATPTPQPRISIRPLPTSTPSGPPRQTVSIGLLVFYDRNENNLPDAGEGIIGLQAQVYDMTDGALLAQGVTDDTGKVAFSVSALGTVKVVVPYLNFEVVVPPNGGALQVKVSPRQLPSVIP
jgi:hypothetical protein